mgnify:CR=1 FL=1
MKESRNQGLAFLLQTARERPRQQQRVAHARDLQDGVVELDRQVAVKQLSLHLAADTTAQARFGAKSGKAVKARRSVVVAAVTEPETTEKPKRKFAKKNITVKNM